jgi:hypothetical protein
MPYFPLLAVHVAAGIVGILSGSTALLFRKGSLRHAQAGKVFVASMLVMAASAAILAFLKHQPNNVGGGILTIYLVLTAWLTARRNDGQTSKFDWALVLPPLLIGIGGWKNGLDALHSLTGEKYGVPGGMHIFMGTVCLLAAAGDIRMLVRGGVSGTQRVVRHLWRMCFGLFIATGSFFLGQGNKVFPGWLRNSPVLLIPALLPLVLLIFWAFRVRLTNTYKKTGSLPTV